MSSLRELTGVRRELTVRSQPTSSKPAAAVSLHASMVDFCAGWAKYMGWRRVCGRASHRSTARAPVTRFSRDPDLFPQMLAHLKPHDWVVVDEVQRLPALLSEVHRLIESSCGRELWALFNTIEWPPSVSCPRPRQRKRPASFTIGHGPRSLRVCGSTQHSIPHDFRGAPTRGTSTLCATLFKRWAP